MDFQVQGSVFVDGEWRSRTADVYQIMARNQQYDDAEMREPDPRLRAEVPELGVLSRTVVESPYHKFVLPANIRHKDLHDIVLIGEDSVQVKEICDYGHLRHIATKSDFKGKILAARVFGEPRKVRVNSSEQSPLLKHESVHRARRSTTADEAVPMPPEVIVLTLSSRTLMFLWASQDQTGPATFRQKTVRLPPGSSRFDRPGAHLAIDPEGRAIAVAAQDGCFIIYRTKTMDKWRADARAGHDELPIVDEALIQIRGSIMHMEFLASTVNHDDSHVVLLLVLAYAEKISVACYDWDIKYSLDAIPVTNDRSVIEDCPSLLIPLDRSTEFLLVCDQYISFYRRVLSGPPTYTKTGFEASILRSLRPGESKSAPRWVQWDKAPRNPEFAKEAFYLAREDGMVVYVERDQGDLLSIVEAGNWPYPIDTAFACLDVDNSEFAQSYPDILISAGAGSDGHLCKVGAWPKEYAYALAPSQRNHFDAIESMPNWSPLTDLAVTRLPGYKLPYERERAGIFVTNGRAPHGEISELRRGLKAVVEDSFGGMKGCTSLSVVDHGSHTLDHNGNRVRQHYATFVVSLPPESIVIRASRTQTDGSISEGELRSAWDSGVWDKTEIPSGEEQVQDDIVRNEETVAACCWADRYAIQITRKDARILGRPTLKAVDIRAFSNTLLLAATKAEFPFIAVSFREDDRTVLELVRILEDGKFPTSVETSLRYDLPCDPTCIELLIVDGIPHVFVGTIDSEIHLLRVDRTAGLVLVYDTRLGQIAASVSQMVCESAVLLTSRMQKMLLCGTRGGSLVAVTLQITNKRFKMLSTVITAMGNTAARLMPSATDNATAFVACGPDFCRVRCPSDDAPIIDVESIWLVDREKSAYVQGPVAALDQLSFAKADNIPGRDFGGLMLIVSGEDMVFAQLDYDVRWSSQDNSPSSLEKSKIVPRKLCTVATPTKLKYIEQMVHKMAVATIEVKEERAPPHGHRTMHSSIKLLNLYDNSPDEDVEMKQEDEISSPTKRLTMGQYPLKHYERVYSIVEWTYADTTRRHQYHFIIVGTGITTGLGKESGRRLFLKVGKSGIKLQKETSFEEPVRCIAVYDDMHIVSIAGRVMAIEKYDPAIAKWVKQGTTELPSAGVHMTTKQPYIYVSTTHDSHICYEVVDSPQDERKLVFEQVFTDSRQRSSAHHLVYRVDYPPEPTSLTQHSDGNPSHRSQTVVLLTDKSCSVTGLIHQHGRTKKSTTETLFEACLPRSVIRIHQGDIRPPWRRPPKEQNQRHAPKPTGVVADDILGACSDGTIYSFSLLSLPARRLLRLVQTLIEAKHKRDPALQYGTVKERSSDILHLLQNGAEGSQDGKIKARDVNPEYQEKGEAAPRFKHIDGDVLIRFFDEDGDLEKLVDDGCDADVRKLFVDSAHVVMGAQTRSGTDAFVWARRWAADVLMPLL